MSFQARFPAVRGSVVTFKFGEGKFRHGLLLRDFVEMSKGMAFLAVTGAGLRLRSPLLFRAMKKGDCRDDQRADY